MRLLRPHTNLGLAHEWTEIRGEYSNLDNLLEARASYDLSLYVGTRSCPRLRMGETSIHGRVNWWLLGIER